MWQKAKIKHVDNAADRQFVGKEIWVQEGPPKLRGADRYDATKPDHRGGDVGTINSYITNLHDNYHAIGITAEFVELLDEFQEDVPLITITDFFNGKV